MYISCLDMEGVLVPEIWIAFSKETGIPELSRTTRDEPDYDKLMRYRLDILKKHGLGLGEVKSVIEKIDPFVGAREFLERLTELCPVIIISDTFEQFAGPLIKKLGSPTLFCNTLIVGDGGEITGYKMRVKNSKLSTVRALQSIGFETVAVGDSYNDISMMRASSAGFLFKTTPAIASENPDIAVYNEFDELYLAMKNAMGK
ncbi:MAG: bifunctional phosphoserine phosphatase/homoserine phosphotransferase ThrH [Clostridia bacterium]|nr:bifunctional phosphoserine phosphatase/homoserine phosphotransferase ThrH [Clostridia bacterium]